MGEVQRKAINGNKALQAKKKKLRKKKIQRFRFMVIALIIFTAGIYMFRNSNESVIGENKISGTNVMLVNKTYRLKDSYVPKDLVKVDIEFLPEATEEEHYMTKAAAGALKNLVAGAAEDGIILRGLSGYRSYETQRSLYNYNMEVNGQSYTDRYVAPPGGSEHQLGEAMDLGTQWGWIYEGCVEAQWLADNAYKYGFIIRYEEGKEDVTGFNYEPWHIRYLGVKTAKKIYESNITLEEYAEK